MYIYYTYTHSTVNSITLTGILVPIINLEVFYMYVLYGFYSLRHVNANTLSRI